MKKIRINGPGINHCVLHARAALTFFLPLTLPGKPEELPCRNRSHKWRKILSQEPMLKRFLQNNLIIGTYEYKDKDLLYQ